MRYLGGEPEEGGVVAGLALLLEHLGGIVLSVEGVSLFGRNAVTAGVFAAKISRHEQRQNSGHGEGSDERAVARVEMRSVPRTVAKIQPQSISVPAALDQIALT